ncbi:hypothetical protein EMIHUDRAFT_463495 [Emiliania huxleyi CCMP1516]|uniref:Fatty acid desaturase domain-containing protein n=2 Tax=Emiliania huxleyi TaxID=2903 RepID=A0A0D3JNZ3_EMIH1|nr:hypothetical protein EMIHUDRAFT_463495 [Emiliania huxleyi CCMP1516]EOD25228.1 hypothetical protein EMIHUDRAFT_463495 [Emiliania huxleyi CCMP1516]|eukprot:XP_005777657.1 hypothetical protein EMIHUDRAFT_463495 [Emiliania huxleyi CCMP1516]
MLLVLASSAGWLSPPTRQPFRLLSMRPRLSGSSMASDELPASSVASDEAVGQREYLIAPRDVDGASGWVETRPDYPLPRMCIVARRGRLTNAAVGEFLQFLGDALALQAPMTVLWDVSSEPGGFPSMEQFRTVNRWLAQNGRAAAYDACVQGHCLFVKQRLRRLGIRTMASIARPPQPVKALPVRIDGEWFDLRRWRAAHPAGVHWLDGFAGRDATDVMLSRLPRLSAAVQPPSLPPASALTLGFRRLRARLVAEGWYERLWWREAQNLLPCLACYGVGWRLARAAPLLATVSLALGSTSAGWIAHDLVHGRGRFCAAMRGFGALMNGHSSTWWRRLQHLYALPVYSALFALWRFNSARTVWSKRLWREAAPMGLNYLRGALEAARVWMALCLPPAVAVGHVLLAGALTATIVTVSHQAEDLFHEHQDDWVASQVHSTRDAVTSSPFSEWLWGGMQYQLEHHLLPTMPRYRYPSAAPLVRQLCAEHGVEYRVDSELGVVRRNFAMLREVARAGAEEGALPTRTETVWSRRDGAAWVGSN